MEPQQFLDRAVSAAREAGAIWPEYMACEAALETGWGESKLCRVANNLLGQKSGCTTRDLKVIDIATDEIIDGCPVHLSHTQWPVFPDWEICFRERMELLRTKSAYAPALAAKTGEEFVRAVSRVWATDPQRADKVLAIYRKHIACSQTKAAIQG